MASRYVPPHLRNKASSSGGPETPSSAPKSSRHDEELFTASEIEAYFWPKKFDPENEDPHGGVSTSSTLHASEETPDKLSYIILFKGANPRWFADKIIYVKSNLDLLPNGPESKEAHQSSEHKHDEEATEKPSVNDSQSEDKPDSTDVVTPAPQASAPLSTPIPIFQEIPASRPRSIRFAGYHTISNFELLEPNSPALVRMLEQKWSSTDRHGNVRHKERDADLWKKSLQWRWAVIKFKSDPKTDEERGTPNIERREEEGGVGGKDGKSVNEMLKELRMGDETKQEVEAHVNEDMVDNSAAKLQRQG